MEKSTKKIVVHLTIKESFKGVINMDQLKMQYQAYRRSKLLQRNREYQRKHMDKQRKELGHEQVKKDKNARQKITNRNTWATATHIFSS